MSLDRKLSEIDARSAEILATGNGREALNLLASNLRPLTNCVRASLRATQNRNGDFDHLHEDMREMLGIKE